MLNEEKVQEREEEGRRGWRASPEETATTEESVSQFNRRSEVKRQQGNSIRSFLPPLLRLIPSFPLFLWILDLPHSLSLSHSLAEAKRET